MNTAATTDLPRPTDASSPAPAAAATRRAFWIKHLHAWHWVSSAACLVGMLLFAVTGITLNHAADIPTAPVVINKTGTLPAALRDALQAQQAAGSTVIDAALVEWTASALGVAIERGQAEWNDSEFYVSLPRPGGDAWLTADAETGEVRYERTDRGWISYVNDLHKGRNTGRAWQWFIDIFAVACVVFTITGLFLLQMHAGSRPTTWPMVGLGLLVPLLLVILFIH